MGSVVLGRQFANPARADYPSSTGTGSLPGGLHGGQQQAAFGMASGIRQ